jgi:hypothetical protein
VLGLRSQVSGKAGRRLSAADDSWLVAGSGPWSLVVGRWRKSFSSTQLWNPTFRKPRNVEQLAKNLGKIGLTQRSCGVAGSRYFFGLVVLVLSTLFWFIAFRFVSFPLLVTSWACLGKFDRGDIRPAITVWTLWLALSFSPIDVFPIPKFGTPKLAPLVMGLPRRKTSSAQSAAK